MSGFFLVWYKETLDKALSDQASSEDLERCEDAATFVDAWRVLVRRRAVLDGDRAVSALLRGLELSSFSPDHVRAHVVALAGGFLRDARATLNRRAELVGGLSRTLDTPLPAPEMLEDGGLRQSLARAVRLAEPHPAWLVPYAARAVATERTHEGARQAWCVTLAAIHRPLASAMSAVADELELLEVGTKHPSDARARRLRRVLASFADAVEEIRTPPGPNVLDGVVRLVRTADPGDKLEGLAPAALALSVALVRRRFTALLDPEAGRIVEHLHRRMGPRAWGALVGSAPEVEALRELFIDAVGVLAATGRHPPRARHALRLLFGDEATADQALEGLAETEGLDGPARAWLMGQERLEAASAPSVLEMAEELDDVANLLVEAPRVEAALDALLNDAASYLRVARPDLAVLTDEAAERVKVLLQSVRRLGRHRGLELEGHIGDVVPYQPRLHRLASGRDAMPGSVRVMVPGVARRDSAGVKSTVREAVAIPVEEDE